MRHLGYHGAAMTSLHDVDELLPQLRLLGTTELVVQGRVVRQLGGRAPALLLARLALAPRQRHTRESLIDHLWPDAPPEVGRNRLRNALSTLRSALSDVGCPGLWEADRDTVRLLPGSLVCDVQRFEEAVGRQQWLDARHVYAGELLPGHFDDWVSDERQRLADLAVRIPAHLPVLGEVEQAAMALVDRASLLARRGTPQFEARALELLEQAQSMAPRFALPRLRLAATLHNRALRLVGVERRQEMARSRSLVLDAARLDPGDARAQAMAVVARYRHGLDFFQARDALLALVERFPDADAPLVGLSMVHNDVGRGAESEAYQRRAQRLEPLSIHAVYNMAVARMNAYRFAPALVLFDEVLELEPDHGVSQIGRVYALAGLGRLDDAVAQSRRAEQTGMFSPADRAYHEALCAHWAGQPGRARALYQQPEVLALCQREPAYGVMRAWHLGQVDVAVAAIRQMVADGDPNLLVVLGSRNGLDTRRHPVVEALALGLGWRPLPEMLAAAARD